MLAELQQLDASAQRANNRYQVATRRLRFVQQELVVNKQALGVARANFAQAQHVLARRLVAIYTSQGEQSSLAVILGAKSVDDLVSRLETVNSVTTQDSTLIREVISYQRAIVRHRRVLRQAHAAQTRLVAVRAAAKRSIDGRLAQEQSLYNSVRGEIQRLEAAQQARQLAEARRAEAAAQAQRTATQLGGFGTSIAGGSVSIPGDKYAQVVSIAMQYLGVPYVWGGASPGGFDCSGLVMYVYAQVGVSLPHYTVAQWDYPNAVSVPRDQLEPGDLVFFDGLGHVGIYIGNGEFIHAPHTGTVVSIDSLNGWYAAEYVGAKRILG
ncbi:MAG TPA: NlpC/P60 family protein [Gaiellaceae bacterium]|nr:NlpC/P60 family protein [Gaiellaceae bacterium]